MPKIKHTTRKEPERPSLAVKELDCSYCGHKFNKSYNYLRHLSYPEPAHGPEQPLSPKRIEAARQRQKAHQRRAAARRSKSAPQPEEPETTKATTRKPTRPAALSCRRVRAVVSIPSPLPRTSISPPSKRRAEMTPSVLAKAVAYRSSKSCREIAYELASTYAMSSSERQTNENRLRAMRAANKEFCSYLRRALPMNRTKKVIANFLTTVEQQCREAEQHDSDEFV